MAICVYAVLSCLFALCAVFVCRSSICVCRYVLPFVAYSVAFGGCVALLPVFVGLRLAVFPCVAVAVRRSAKLRPHPYLHDFGRAASYPLIYLR